MSHLNASSFLLYRKNGRQTNIIGIFTEQSQAMCAWIERVAGCLGMDEELLCFCLCLRHSNVSFQHAHTRKLTGNQRGKQEQLFYLLLPHSSGNAPAPMYLLT